MMEPIQIPINTLMLWRDLAFILFPAAIFFYFLIKYKNLYKRYLPGMPFWAKIKIDLKLFFLKKPTILSFLIIILLSGSLLMCFAVILYPSIIALASHAPVATLNQTGIKLFNQRKLVFWKEIISIEFMSKQTIRRGRINTVKNIVFSTRQGKSIRLPQDYLGIPAEQFINICNDFWKEYRS